MGSLYKFGNKYSTMMMTRGPVYRMFHVCLNQQILGWREGSLGVGMVLIVTCLSLSRVNNHLTNGMVASWPLLLYDLPCLSSPCFFHGVITGCTSDELISAGHLPLSWGEFLRYLWLPLLMSIVSGFSTEDSGVPNIHPAQEQMTVHIQWVYGTLQVPPHYNAS